MDEKTNEDIETAFSLAESVAYRKLNVLDGFQYSLIFDGLAKAMSSCLDPNDERFIPHAARLHTIYAYADFDNLEPEEAFCLGACWGAFETADSYLSAPIKESARQEEEKHRKNLIEQHRDLISYVQRNPGISYIELEQHMKIEHDDLTQIISELRREKILTTYANGQNRHYYLSKYSQQILEDQCS